MLDKVKKIGINLGWMISFLFMSGTVLYYNVAFDYFLIFILLASSLLLGNLFDIKGTQVEKFFMKLALGLGLVGTVIYFILLLGVGNKSVYIFLLFFCMFLGIIRKGTAERLKGEFIEFRRLFFKYQFLITILMIFLGLYTMYGSFPMSKYDTLTKHLPMTLYAVENGTWYTNVTEAIVYGDPMVLQYTYAVFFASLGAYKALVLFNVVMLFLLYIIIGYFTRRIYQKNNLFVMAIMLLTTPFYFEFSTVFYLEILPLFFLFAAFIGTAELDRDKIWQNIEVISLICGFSLFVKLTHIFTLFMMVVVLAVCCILKAMRERRIGEGILKAFRCIFLAIAPSCVSIFYIYYKTGNPFFPSYNGFFKSPYFEAYNFVDPFKNKLSFSIHSLIDIVFYTNKNIEMGRYGLGVFLFGFFAVPIALIILYRKKKNLVYLVWVCTAIMSYIANTVTSYNLRYYSAVWILLMCIIGIAMSVCIEVIKIKSLRIGGYGIVCLVLIVPNISYIRGISQFSYKIIKDESMVRCDYCTFFDLIPSDKRVLSITNSSQFKGQYIGYFASTTWHNSTLDRVINGEYTWNDYISSFDYILIDKYAGEIISEPDIYEIVQPMLGEKLIENDACILYTVLPQREKIFDYQYDEPKESRLDAPVAEVIANDYGKYYVKHQIINEYDENIPVRFQINWINSEGTIVDVYIEIYEAEKGENIYFSKPIPTNKEAEIGFVYAVPADEKKIKVTSFEVEGFTDVIETEMEMFESRERLKKQKNGEIVYEN